VDPILARAYREIVRLRTLGWAGCGALVVLVLASCAPVQVNVAEPGHGFLGTGVSHRPELSDDGDIAAIETADYLTSDDHVGEADVYVRDLRRGDTALASISPAGLQDQCGTLNPSISGNGRFVAWAACSADADLVAPPPPGTVGTRVFVKDRVSGALDQIGIAESLNLAGGGFGFLDRDGSHIVIGCFLRMAGSPNSVCVQDRRTGETTIVSRRNDGQIVPAFAVPTSISDDGNLVAFTAPTAAVVPGSTDSRRQLFVRDVSAGVTKPITIDPSILAGDVDGPISGDGTAAVIMQSQPPYHVVHKDLVTGAVRRVDQSGCVPAPASSTHGFGTISDDGDVVAFESTVDTLVPHDTNGHDDVFVWRASAPCAVQRVSLGALRQQGDGESYWPAISGDGESVAFVSEATNFARVDVPGPDAFVVKIHP
jgi:hypothetical protein